MFDIRCLDIRAEQRTLQLYFERRNQEANELHRSDYMVIFHAFDKMTKKTGSKTCTDL